MKKTIQQQGFSMIEVLVTLVIIATALLGTAGLQAHALKTSKGSEFRNQAIFLSADIVERMEANKVAAVAGSYAVAAGPGAISTRCDAGGLTAGGGAAACAPPALAAYDLSNWQAAVAVLPSGVGVITGAAGSPTTYTITVSWTDRATAAPGQAAAGVKQETFSITTTKTIRN
jgi:type IV pilus assembly protein PilV